MSAAYSPIEVQLQGHALRLAGKAWGPEDGPRLLALHGWLDNANSYDLLAPLLPNYRVVAVDMAGHGRSQHRSADAGYHFVDYTFDVMEVADALGWTTFCLMGHSMGAAVGAVVAGTFPERIERLVMLDAIGPAAVSAEQVPVHLARHIRDEQRRGNKEPRPLPDLETAVRLWAQVVPRLSLDNARRLVVRNTREVLGGVAWTYDARLRGTSSLRFSEEQVLAFLKRITCPALFVRALDGLALDPEQTTKRQAAITDLAVVELTGGHHVHMEDAATVAFHVRAFLPA